MKVPRLMEKASIDLNYHKIEYVKAKSPLDRMNK